MGAHSLLDTVGEIGHMIHGSSEGGCASRGRRYPAPTIGHRTSAAAISPSHPGLLLLLSQSVACFSMAILTSWLRVLTPALLNNS
jgi:hypothetical protein